MAAHGRVLPSRADGTHARERPLPPLARPFPRRRRADGPGQPRPFRRLFAGSLDAHEVKPGDHVPGLDRGGWFDAGDHDLRIESQADTVHGLALAWELFKPALDNTSIDEDARLVEIHQPDGKPDVLQQIEHGVLTIVGGYNSMGRLYRGIQDASLHQYTFLGDAAGMTDNKVFQDRDGSAMRVLAAAALAGDQSEPKIDHLPPLGSPGSADDRCGLT